MTAAPQPWFESPGTQRDPWRHEGSLLVALVVGAAVLRFTLLSQESYWYDELQSVLLTQGSVRDMLHALVQSDVHPPLYFLLLWIWERGFGSGEAATRALSAVCGALSVGAMFGFGRALAGRAAGLLAAGFIALSPFAVFYAQETRSYALNLLLALLGGWCLALWCGAPSSRRAMASYVVVAVLTAYTHVYGLFVLVAHGIYVLCFEPRLRWRFLAAAALVALCFAPWVPFLLGQIARVERNFWIPAITWRSPLSWLWFWGGLTLPTGFVALLLTVLGARVPWTSERPAGPARPGALLALLVAVPVLVPVAISLVSQPIFHPKYAISILGPVALWNARALLALQSRPLRQWLVAGVLAMWAIALCARVYGIVNKEQWREIAGDARRAARGGTRVIAERDTARCLRWYLPDVPVRSLDTAGDVASVERGAREILYVEVHPDHTDREPLLDHRWHRRDTTARYGARAVRYEVAP